MRFRKVSRFLSRINEATAWRLQKHAVRGFNCGSGVNTEDDRKPDIETQLLRLRHDPQVWPGRLPAARILLPGLLV